MSTWVFRSDSDLTEEFVWVDFRTQCPGHGLVTFSRWLVAGREQASKEKSVPLSDSFVLEAFFYICVLALGNTYGHSTLLAMSRDL